MAMPTRFLGMHKNDEHTEAGLMPPLERVQQMGAYVGELARKGQFIGGEGLRGSSTRTRLMPKPEDSPLRILLLHRPTRPPRAARASAPSKRPS
jgi:hypothetical protein